MVPSRRVVDRLGDGAHNREANGQRGFNTGAAGRSYAGWRSLILGPRHGHPKTASGARLHAGALTAASPNLPLGARSKVTNVETGKSVNVVVTDRGPYAKRRVLDVSRAAADRLGGKRKGVATVAVKLAAVP
jgi:rare lipoprotein A